MWGFLGSFVLFIGAVYGLLRFYKWRNNGLYQWQNAPAPSAPPVTPAPPPSGPSPKL